MERWFREWFDIAAPAPGEDVSLRLRLPMAWPAWLILLATLAAVAFVWYVYRREHAEAGRWRRLLLALLRLSALASLLLMLFELDFVVDRRGLPYLLVMLDHSQSMSLGDRYLDRQERQRAEELASIPGPDGRDEGGLPQRLAIARGILLRNDAELLLQLAEQYRLRIYAAGASATLLAEIQDRQAVPQAREILARLEADSPETKLGDAVRKVLSELGGVPPAALIVLTDGVLTEGTPWDEAARLARRKGVPLHFVGIGEPTAALDLELRDLVADDVAFVGDTVRFEAKVVARGLSEPREVRVQLFRQGEGLPLAEQRVQLREADRPVNVQLRYEPKKEGEQTFVIQVQPIARERDTANNSIRHAMIVRDQQLKVLLVDTFPRLEYRFLKHYLERDRTVELRTVLVAADPQHPEQDRTALAAFPVSPEELNQFDAVILGDVSPLYFQPSQIEMLAQFVLEQAGGLVLIAGRQFMPMRWRDTPLDPLIPFDLQEVEPSPGLRDPFRIRLTVEGESLPIFSFGRTLQESRSIWRSLPGHYWYLRAPKLKPGAMALAVHPTERGVGGPLPLIALQYAGAGKVLALAIDSTWRWRDMARDRYFGRFWVQTLRYVTRSRLLGLSRQAELTVDRRRYLLGQPVRIRVRILDDSVLELASEGVTVTVQSGASLPVRLRLTRDESLRGAAVFRTRWVPPGEGSYQVVLVTPPVKGESPRAAFQVQAAPNEFRRVEMAEAELKQAARISGGSFHRLADYEALFRSLPTGRKVPLEVEPPVSLWDTWPMLLLFAVLLTLEWSLRKRWKML